MSVQLALGPTSYNLFIHLINLTKIFIIKFIKKENKRTIYKKKTDAPHIAHSRKQTYRMGKLFNNNGKVVNQ